jgi:hypothetical protein
VGAGATRVNHRAALAGDANALKAGLCDFSFQGAFLADESKDGGLIISSHMDLLDWLDSLPPEQGRWVAVAIGTRAALRVLPLVATNTERKRSFENLTFAVFFATALARVAAVYPTRAKEFRDAANAANAANAAVTAANAAAYAARAAAYAASATAYAAADATTATVYAANAALAAADATHDAASAVIAVAIAADALWAAASRDAKFIAAGGEAQTLACEPLWADGEPDWSTQHWKLLQDALTRESDWWVWIGWYARRLKGVSDPEEIELVFATVPDKEREAGPAVANRWIKEQLEKLQEVNSLLNQPEPPTLDYFISYSALDEADAREVATVLEQAGHSTFAQFKDIATGNNFVREMQSGLDGSGRMIALYSPEYDKSDHCQAEWSAAYNSDPSGKKRKLIPFLLRPTALNSLARQVAYKSLVGLSKEARKAAILDAIAPQPAKRDVAQIRAELAETASPQPALNENSQLDAGPNKVFDKPFVDQDLVELPYTQRALIKTIRRALPPNTPKIVDSALLSYDEQLQERGSQPIVGLLNQLASALEKEIKASGPELMGAGRADLFESFFSNHSLLATHFPLKNEEKFADIPVDENIATGKALTQPIEDVSKKMKDAVDSGLVTEKIGKIASNSAQFAKDIAPLPPDASASEPGSRRVTLKRRYVLGTLGFLVALYNLLGSTASIIATEQGAALFEAVRKAIEALSKFLL